ncbi:aminoglycoside phosphotransferase family protein [Luteococcus sanguinis]|uniref:Phosphotransferase n=1 Tax=Luteococcus sanguinis TaxID=174038 RepID=A0ABW1X2P0_9ACTN
MALTATQCRVLDDWFPGHVLVADMSWGLVDTVVQHHRWHGGEVVVKAAGPGNHHIGREITGREQWCRPWHGRIGCLLHASPELNVIAVEYLPGVLVQDSTEALDPELHRQAGELLARFHRQASRQDPHHELSLDARALRWLEGPHRIAPAAERLLRERIAAHAHPVATLVPTHGDWQERNWLVHQGRLFVIDLGRFDWRPAATDLVRLDRREWRDRPELAEAFVKGYGSDPRQASGWERINLREAVGTVCWANQVGDEAFEAHGFTHLAECLGLDESEVRA